MIILSGFCILLIFFSELISPYKDEWDTGLKEKSDNAILVLTLMLTVLLLVSALGMYLYYKKSSLYKLFFLCFAVYSLLRIYFIHIK